MSIAERRNRTKKIIKRRVKEIWEEYVKRGYIYNIGNKIPAMNIIQPHRLHKMKALGCCKRKQCRSCHKKKLDDKIPETQI